jgi:NTE family protein
LKFNIVLFYLFTALGLFAQDNDRPRIGLVLSGGSAHGLAHIGVLQYLDQQHIPIDYVTGTSMGAIIGGLYAMGMNGIEIEKLAKSQDWKSIMSNKLVLNEVAPSEKFCHDRFALNFKINQGEIHLPQGFINSQKLDLTINRLYAAAYDLTSFDSLPRPFRCVAVDIESGAVKIFSDGFLGDGVRASMAIPSVFAPKQIDDRLYVDGGLRRNFPVQENRALGSDIIIGSYVGGQLEEKDQLKSLLSILGQSAFMMGILDSEEQKKDVDILIEPNVKEDFNSFDFVEAEAMIHQGYIAALDQEEAISNLKNQLGSSLEVSAQKLKKPSNFLLSKIEYPLTSVPFDQLANFKFGSLKSKVYTLNAIETGIGRIYGTKHFDNINYDIVETRMGKSLSIEAPEKIGIDLFANINYFPTTGTSFIFHSDLRNIMGKPSTFKMTFRLSEMYAGRVDYQYRMGHRKDHLLLIEGSLQKYEQYSYQGSTLRADYEAQDFYSSLGFAHEPNNDFWLGIKAGLRVNNIEPNGVELGGLESYRRSNYFTDIFAEYNTLDRPSLASQGNLVFVSMGYDAMSNSFLNTGRFINEFVPEEKNYWTIEASLRHIQPIVTRISLDGKIRVAWKSDPSFLDNYRIGGLERRGLQSIDIIGLNTDQFHFTNYYNIGGQIRVNIFKEIFASIRADYISGDRAFQFRSSDILGEHISFGSYGFVGSLLSPIGPVHLAFGTNTATHQWVTNLTFGYTFF